MTIKLPYGSDNIEIQLSESVTADFLEGQSRLGETDERIIERSLDQPRNMQKLEDVLNATDRVAIVVSDYTRSTGVSTYLPLILKRIDKAGVKPKNVRIVIALGLHRKATETEINEIVGANVTTSYSVENHDPDRNLVDLGAVALNQTVASASKVVVTGAVAFHPMIGYSGGYKSVLPGIASRKDILMNHMLYLDSLNDDRKIEPARLEENPVFLDLARRGNILHNIFALNIVMGKNKQIAYASSGNLPDVWRECINFLNKNFSVAIYHRYPLVLASAGGLPMDFSFYQSMKLFTNASAACSEGETIILLSKCCNGWELRKDIFRLFECSVKKAEAALRTNFSMDGLAILMARLIIERFKVFFFSDLPANEVSKTGMIPIINQDALREMFDRLSRDKRCAIIRRAASVFPVMKGERL